MRIRLTTGWVLIVAVALLLPADRLLGAGDVAAAAKAGDLATVRKLILAHADVNVPGADSSPALLWAAYNSDVEMARALLAAGARVNTANRYGVTPLLQASRTGDTTVMAALLEAGADAKAIPPNAETPLMAAARTGRIDAVRLLMAAGADVNAGDAVQKETALMWAAAEGHAPVVDALLESGANANLRSAVTPFTKREHADHPSGGFTALMFAARNGHEDVVKALAKRGADLEAVNGDAANGLMGATATIIAIVNDRLDLAATLLELGADPNDGSLYHAVDMHDATTDMRARDGSQLRANYPNKLSAFDLITLLLDKGADPNKPFVGQLHSTSLCCGDMANGTPFFRAAVAADVDVLKLMIERGANIEWVPSAVQQEGDGAGGGAGGGRGNVGRTPLMVAMTGGRGAPFAAGPGFNREGPPPFREAANRKPVEAVKALLAAGAKPDTKAPDGSTALHQAADRGNLDMIRALAEGGATLDIKNKDGLTALEVVEKPATEGRGRGAGAAAAMMGDMSTEKRATKDEVAALLRELMGLPPAPSKVEGPAPPKAEGKQ
jgi:ankyrin repeat protein